MDPCKLTYCNACYYNETTLTTPAGCGNSCEDRLCLACVREWAGCVEERNKRDNEVQSKLFVYLATYVCIMLVQGRM